MNFFHPKSSRAQSARHVPRAAASNQNDSKRNGYAHARSQKLLSEAAPSPQRVPAVPSPAKANHKKCYSYRSLQNDLKQALESLCDDSTNSDLCDATFEIGRRCRRFNVVAALFAIHSTELNRMLQEKEEEEDRVIVVDDITEECFEFLRLYFYCLNPAITVQNVSYILYAAKKLKIGALIEAAKEFILAVKGVDDLLLILSLLHALKLMEMCNEVIVVNKLNEDAAKVFHSENLNLLPTELMILLLKQATFPKTRPMTEEAVFEKCVVWAKHVAGKHAVSEDDAESAEEQMAVEVDDSDDDEKEEEVVAIDPEHWKSVIQPLLLHVRFPNMEGEYFAAKVVELKLLSFDDCTFIMQCLLTGKESKFLKYSTKKRTVPAQRQYATSSNEQYAKNNSAAK